MSLSRKLIERLVHDEISSKNDYESYDRKQLDNLAQQIFLGQITQADTKEQRKSIRDKIEQFHGSMQGSN